MNIERLKTLSQTPGVSGAEGAVAALLEQELTKLHFTCHKDAFGNLHAHRPGSGKHILLEAHMDQVGMMVSDITEEGFIRFSPIGGLDLRMLPFQEVLIAGKETISGVVVLLPRAANAEQNEKLTLDRFCIDTGLGRQVKEYVSIGDRITFNGKPFVRNGRFFGQALDNRASVELVLSLIESVNLSAELSVLFAVQEETGLFGAAVGTYHCKADLAIVLDVTFGRTHGSNEAETFECGAGPAIGLGPSVSRKDAKQMIRIADEKKIPYQVEVMGGSSGTDAWVIQLSDSGIPTVMLSLPLRYMHTPVEQFSISDFENAVLLLAAYLKEVCADA